MKFYVDLTVLPTHIENNWATAKFKIDKGLIKTVGVYFPAGCNGKVYARVMLDAHQIFPRNPEGWVHGEDGWSEGQVDFPATADPLQITIEAWNDRCIFQHVITLAIEITPWQRVPPYRLITDFLVSLGDELGLWEEQTSEH